MAKVICNMDCKHRSNRPLRTYRSRDGKKCYGCTLDAISVTRIFDIDGDIESMISEDNMAHCADYEPMED